MIFTIIVGGYMVARFLAVTGLTDCWSNSLLPRSWDASDFCFCWWRCILLGAMLDVLGMLVLTIPFCLSRGQRVGGRPHLVWRVRRDNGGVSLDYASHRSKRLREAAGCSDVPREDIFRGVLPFVFGELAVLALLILFPEMALWLVGQMG